MTYFMLMITFMGSWKTILFLNLILIFFLNKKIKLFLTIALSSLSNLVIVEPLKILIREPRPLGGLIVENSFSFPSGHAYSAVTFYGLLTYLLYKKTKNKLILIPGIIFIGLIAYSRIYLGVHYWHDVIAGLILGGLWLGGIIYLSTPRPIRPTKIR